MNQYYVPLCVKNNEALRRDWVMPFQAEQEYIEFFRGDYSSILHPTFLEKLNSISLINGILIINRNGSKPETTAHTDVRFKLSNGKPLLTLFGINIVIDRSNTTKSSMQWFSFNTEHPVENRQETTVQTNIVSYAFDQLNLAENHTISEYATIVRTDKPHAIVLGDGTRTSISIRFVKQWNTWEQVVSDFKAVFDQ